ncbi:hypothetical protein ACA910_014762 [Epithemia clementina (nom. ined.)]
MMWSRLTINSLFFVCAAQIGAASNVPPRPYLRSLQEIDSTPSPSVSDMPSIDAEDVRDRHLQESTPSPSVSDMPSLGDARDRQLQESTPSPSVSDMPSTADVRARHLQESTPSPSVSDMPSTADARKRHLQESTPSPSVSGMPSFGDDAIPCGPSTCFAEEICCSESCGICTKLGEACEDQDCSL